MKNIASHTGFCPPAHNCDLCPRLVKFRIENQHKFPDKFNAPVPSFGTIDAQFLIVGLAPGLKGANFTGRPFTGDYAGDLLYPTLVKCGFATGQYIGLEQACSNDSLQLQNCRITNAVRCVPPENKPIGTEMNNCRLFLVEEMAAMPRLKVVMALGLIAHNAVLKSCGEKLSAYKFTHGVQHQLANGLVLCDSYHCSRYNTNTGRLTTAMFEEVVTKIRRLTD